MNTSISYLKEKAVNLKWWQIALIATGVSFLGKLAGGSETGRQKLYTRKLKQAPWAPPAAVFGPAWTFNNFTLLMGLQKILKNEDMPEKRKLLLLQAGIWAIFFSFNYIYFKKKSPVLAAIWTVSDAVLAGASMVLARKLHNKEITLSYLPLAAWTTFASSLGIFQALKNPDQALGTPQLVD